MSTVIQDYTPAKHWRSSLQAVILYCGIHSSLEPTFACLLQQACQADQEATTAFAGAHASALLWQAGELLAPGAEALLLKGQI